MQACKHYGTSMPSEPFVPAEFAEQWIRDASGRFVAPPQPQPVERPDGPWLANGYQEVTKEDSKREPVEV